MVQTRVLLSSLDKSGIGEMWNGLWVRSLGGWLLRGAETKVARSFFAETPALNDEICCLI